MMEKEELGYLLDAKEARKKQRREDWILLIVACVVLAGYCLVSK